MFEDTGDTDFGTRPGKTGAARQTYAADNPRAIMAMLIAKHPTWDKETLFSHWRERMEENDRHRNEVYEYWFTNNHRSYQADPKQAKQAEAKKKAKVKDIIAQISLLTMIAPNGKPLSECTGTECEEFGGWYVAVGRRVGSQLVGTVMTEDALQTELHACRKRR